MNWQTKLKRHISRHIQKAKLAIAHALDRWLPNVCTGEAVAWALNVDDEHFNQLFNSAERNGCNTGYGCFCGKYKNGQVVQPGQRIETEDDIPF